MTVLTKCFSLQSTQLSIRGLLKFLLAHSHLPSLPEIKLAVVAKVKNSTASMHVLNIRIPKTKESPVRTQILLFVLFHNKL